MPLCSNLKSIMENMIFKSKEFGEIRTMTDEQGEPWFCLADICRILEIKSVSVCKSRLKIDGVCLAEGVSNTTNQYGATTKQKLMLTFINEQNLYKVIMRSDKPQAEGFQDWVCGEVLPAIRKHGGYMAVRADEPDEVILSRALLIMQKALERRDKRIAELEPRAAYADEVIDSVSCLTTTQVAKGLGMTAIELNRRLCRLGIQYCQSGQYLLYAGYARQGYAQNRTYMYRDAEGETHTRAYLVWTERGREFIHSLLTDF